MQRSSVLFQLKDRLIVQADLVLHPVCKALTNGKGQVKLRNSLLVVLYKPETVWPWYSELGLRAGLRKELLTPSMFEFVRARHRDAQWHSQRPSFGEV